MAVKAILQGQLTDISSKQDTLTFDDLPQEGSSNPVKSGGVWSELQRKSNPNLLDNWYFVNPVNQRGLTEYINSYCVDRWILSNAACTVEDGGIVIINNFSDNTVSAFHQKLNKYMENAVRGRTVTLSVLVDAGVYSLTYDIPAEGPFDSPNRGVDQKGNDYDGWVIDILQTGNGNVSARIYSRSGQKVPSIKVLAMKLELGDHQTLAHQDAEGNWVLNDPPPDYGTELLKCQQYQFIIAATNNAYATAGVGAGNNTERALICVPIPIKMRTSPTVSYSGKWGLTAGFRSADDILVTNIAASSVGNSDSLLNVLAYAESGKITYCDFYGLRASNDPTARIIFDANL